MLSNSIIEWIEESYIKIERLKIDGKRCIYRVH